MVTGGASDWGTEFPLVYVPVTHNDLLTRIAANGTNNLWVKRKDGIVTKAVQYELDYVFTAEETAINQAIFVDEGGDACA
jgi:hypothetical protein